MEHAKSLFEDLERLESEPLKAARRIRRHLIKKGFCYDDGVFTLSEVVSKKKGNCLGLTLLVGTALIERGFRPGFRIITHPLDAVHQEDLRLFAELNRGDHFTYDLPILPKTHAELPAYRFAPLEHPLLVIEGQEFDLTNLDIDEDPAWTPPAEKRFDTDLCYIASCVLVDRAQVEFLSDRPDYTSIADCCEQALDLQPDSLQAWELLWYVGKKRKDTALKQKARDRYLKLGGVDSRYYYNAYEMTHDIEYLNSALEIFPAYMDAFFEKNVVRVADVQEKRFNFAVAAWCVANSCAYDLRRFYREHQKLVKRLFPESQRFGHIKR